MSLGEYTAVKNDDPHDNITVKTDGNESFILLCNVTVYALQLSVTISDINSLGKGIGAVVSGKKKRVKVKLSGGGMFYAFCGNKDGQTFLEFDLSFTDPNFGKEADAEFIYKGFEADELTAFSTDLCSFNSGIVSVRKIRKGELI